MPIVSQPANKNYRDNFDEVFKKNDADPNVLHETIVATELPTCTHGHPRRICITCYSPAETAIREAMVAVEAVGAHPKLTEAVVLLGRAKDAVADYVDKID